MASKLKAGGPFKPLIQIDGVEIQIIVSRLSGTEWEEFHKNMRKFGFDESEQRGAEKPPNPEFDAEAEAWMKKCLAEYVKLPVGEIEDENDVPVTDGMGLYRLYSARMDVIPQVLMLIWIENRLPENRKNVLRSRLASELGSTPVLRKTDIGPKPDSAATDADNSNSASDGDATENQPEPSSGTTEPSN